MARLTDEGAARLIWQLVPHFFEVRLLGSEEGFAEPVVVGYAPQPLAAEGWWVSQGSAAHRELSFRLVGPVTIHGWFIVDPNGVPLFIHRYDEPIRLEAGGKFRVIPSLSLKSSSN